MLRLRLFKRLYSQAYAAKFTTVARPRLKMSGTNLDPVADPVANPRLEMPGFNAHLYYMVRIPLFD